MGTCETRLHATAKVHNQTFRDSSNANLLSEPCL